MLTSHGLHEKIVRNALQIFFVVIVNYFLDHMVLDHVEHAIRRQNNNVALFHLKLFEIRILSDLATKSNEMIR